MSSVILADATTEHTAMLLPYARQIDVDEWVMGMGGVPVRTSVRRALKESPVARVAIGGKSGRPFAMWGASRGSEPDLGILWAIGTDDMTTMGRAVQRHWATEMALLHQAFPRLACAVWERNANHVKWLSVMGFRRMGSLPGTVLPLTIYTRERT